MDLSEIEQFQPKYDTACLILPDLSIKEWAATGEAVFGMRASMDWWLGDWLVYGEEHYGDDIYQYINCDLSYGTLWAIKKVCKTIAPEKRRKELSFAHHHAVAYLESEEERDKYLDIAVKKKIGKNSLIRLIRTDKKAAKKEGIYHKHLCFISVPYSQNPQRGIELSIKAGRYLKKHYVPIPPVLMFKDLFNNGDEYDIILKACLKIIHYCPHIFIVLDGEMSKGQKMELEFAKKRKKDIIYINAEDLEGENENRQF